MVESDNVLETVPDEAERLRQGVVEKKILGRNGIGRWEQRFAIYTRTTFVLTKPGENAVLDCIPMVEIAECNMVELQSTHGAIESPIGTRSVRSPRGEAKALAESKKAFDDVDADQTGSVSLEEFAAMRCNDGLSRAEVEAVFAKLDKDGNGALSLDEFVEYRKAAAEAAAMATKEDDSEEANKAVFNIITVPGGYNGGRTFSLRVPSQNEGRDWVAQLSKAVSEAKHDAEMRALGGWFARLRGRARYWYQAPPSQTFFALVIIASFVAACMDAEWQPPAASRLLGAFALLELVFAIIFGAELAFNLFGSWMRPFLSSGWNWCVCPAGPCRGGGVSVCYPPSCISA